MKSKLNIIFIIMTFLIVYPFLIVVAISFSDENAVINEGYKLFPSAYSLEAYKFVFKNPLSVLNDLNILLLYAILV